MLEIKVGPCISKPFVFLPTRIYLPVLLEVVEQAKTEEVFSIENGRGMSEGPLVCHAVSQSKRFRLAFVWM